MNKHDRAYLKAVNAGASEAECLELWRKGGAPITCYDCGRPVAYADSIRMSSNVRVCQRCWLASVS